MIRIRKIVAVAALVGVAVVGAPAVSQAASPAPTSVSVQASNSGWDYSQWVSYGARGGHVRDIQRAVGTTPDGVWGPLTQAAVLRAQRSAGVTPDGIVGPVTARALGLTGGSNTKPPVSSKPAPKPPASSSRGLEAEANHWAKKMNVIPAITFQTERWNYGSAWPQWSVARERGFMMNLEKIKAEQGTGQRAVAVSRSTAIHESVHYHQARLYGDATTAPASGRSGIPAYEVQADCATHLVAQKHGVTAPTFYIGQGNCTAAEYDNARQMLRSAGLL